MEEKVRKERIRSQLEKAKGVMVAKDEVETEGRTTPKNGKRKSERRHNSPNAYG